MTSEASTPTASDRAPISFANVTLTAWNALHAYLIISAVRNDTMHGDTGSDL